MEAISESSTTKPDHPWLGELVFGLDSWLRRRNAVTEYTRDPRCVFRIQIGRLDRKVALSDGTLASVGDRVINLHLWNEHIPITPTQGASIGWARLALGCAQVSFRELARYLAARPELDDISVLCASATCGVPEQRAQVARLCARLGFEVIADPAPITTVQRAHRLGENILFSLMVLARNANALRGDTLRRDRVEAFLSRKLLARRYGAQRTR
jgi:YkoP domain